MARKAPLSLQQFWKELDASLAQIDALDARAIGRYRAQVASLHDELKRKLVAQEWNVYQLTKLRSEIDAVILAAAERMRVQGVDAAKDAWLLGAQSVTDLSAAFKVSYPLGWATQPLSQDVVAAFTFDRIAAVTEEMRGAIQSVVTGSLISGGSPFEAMYQITHIVGIRDAAGFRELGSTGVSAKGERILRTELMTATNVGTQTQLQGLERQIPELEKVWLATGDFRTRDSHFAAHGQRRKVGEPFVVGGSPGQFPGDPALPARERINCRCRQVPYNPEWGPLDELLQPETARIDAERLRRAKGVPPPAPPPQPPLPPLPLPPPVLPPAPKTTTRVRRRRGGARPGAPVPQVEAGMPAAWSMPIEQALADQAAGLDELTAKIVNARKAAGSRITSAEVAQSRARREYSGAIRNLDWQVKTGAGTPGHEEVVAALKRAADDALQAMIAAEQKLAGLRLDTVRNALRLPEAERMKLTISEAVRTSMGTLTPEPLQLGLKQASRQLEDLFSEIIDRRSIRIRPGVPTTGPGELPLRMTYRHATDRAFHTSGEAFLFKGDDIYVYAHELGHGLEWGSLHFHNRAVEYLQYRTRGEKLVQLRKVLKSSGYRANEVTRPDRFMTPYWGKWYTTGDVQSATEILSSGIESLLREPRKFAQQDPETFRFIVGLLQGRL